MENSNLKFSQLRSIFGNNHSTPIKFSYYFSNSSKNYTNDVSGIPTIGNKINLGLFKGKNKNTADINILNNSGVIQPPNDNCNTVINNTSQYNLPIVKFGDTNWYLQHNFGSTGRWNGLQLRNFTNSTITLASNNNDYSLPTNINDVMTDWQSNYTGPYGIGGYKDYLSNGINNMYLNFNSIFGGIIGTLTSNQRASSSMMFYIPSWVQQVGLLVADYYRSSNSSSTTKNSYWYSQDGSTWTNIGIASWRGSQLSNGYIPQNPNTNADLAVFNVSNGGYLLILEGGYTIASVGAVLLK